MKRFLALSLLFSLFGSRAAAQSESPAQKAAMANLHENYNRQQYDSIFTLFSPDMQKALSQTKTAAFFGGLQRDAGAIKNYGFSRISDGAATYKTVFERGTFEILLSVDGSGRISGLLVKPWKEPAAAKMTSNTTPLALPFRDAWTVVWGGDTKEQNYHVESEAQKGAFDMVINNASGKTYRTDGKTNDDYYAFGKELLAPCEGEVVMVVDGIKDNIPGEMNPVYVPGNTVIIRTAANEYLFFAHFKQHSIKVKQGQKVARGELLGLCGNSGNSSEPHLHFHIQDAENMTKATGVKCFFEKVKVAGVEKRDYSPVQGEVVSGK